MSQAQLRRTILACEYKPGWSFDLESGDFPMLLITANVPNSRGPGRIEFTVKRLIPDYVRRGSDAIITEWVKSMVIEAEVHEVREFFRYKGKLVDDPHTFMLIDEPPTFMAPVRKRQQPIEAGSTRPAEWPRLWRGRCSAMTGIATGTARRSRSRSTT